MYYPQYQTGDTQALIEKATPIIDQILAQNNDPRPLLDQFFLRLAIQLSHQTIVLSEGGPFAAIIVKYDRNKPMIMGIGSNHVVPENDPSAHGELSAIRDATHRLGYTDLSDAILFSSCECCPQCYAAIAGVGITHILFANDRFQAAAIGFSDDQQYQYLKTDVPTMCHIDAPAIGTRRTEWLKKLGDHEAVILDETNTVIAYGHSHVDTQDPLASLSAMNAIQLACQRTGHCHLSDKHTLVTQKQVHPVTFSTADWARIGRVKETNPAHDTISFQKDPTKLVYVVPTFEEIRVRNQQEQVRVVHRATDILFDSQRIPSQRQLVVTQRTTDPQLRAEAQAVFSEWEALTKQSPRLRY